MDARKAHRRGGDAEPPPPARYLPLRHMQATFGISRSQAYALAKAGKIVMRKAERATLVEVASVDAYLAAAPRVK